MPPIEETESALLDWQAKTGRSMAEALDEFQVTDQMLRNEILARNFQRVQGLEAGAAMQAAQRAQEPASRQMERAFQDPRSYGMQRGGAREAASFAQSPEGAPVAARAAGEAQAYATQAGEEPLEMPAYYPKPIAPEGKQDPKNLLFGGQQGAQVQGSYRGIPGGGQTGKLAGLAEEYRGAAEQARAGTLERGQDIASALGEEQKAMRAMADAEISASREAARVLDERQKAMTDLEAKQAEREQRRQSLVQRDMDALKTTIEGLKQSRVDPTRFFKTQSGEQNYGKTILASVAVALGAMGEQLQGRGGNPTLDIIQSAINRDIQAQREDLANRRAGVGMEMNLLGQMRAQFADERQAETATRLAMLNSYEMKLDQVAARTKNQQIIARYKREKSNLNVRKAELANQFAAQADQQALQSVSQQFGMETQRQQLGLQQRQFAMAQRAAQAKAQGRGMPPGLVQADPSYTPDKDDLKEAKKMRSALDGALGELTDLVQWADEYGFEVFDREALKVANVKLNRLKSAMRTLDNTGARLDPSEIEMMGLPEDMGGKLFLKKQLETVKGSIIRKTQDSMTNSYGVGLNFARMGQGYTGETEAQQR